MGALWEEAKAIVLSRVLCRTRRLGWSYVYERRARCLALARRPSPLRTFDRAPRPPSPFFCRPRVSLARVTCGTQCQTFFTRPQFPHPLYFFRPRLRSPFLVFLAILPSHGTLKAPASERPRLARVLISNRAITSGNGYR